MNDKGPMDQPVSLMSRLADWIAMPEQMHGTSITEVELAAIFGVSRTPLREALNFASAIGLLRRERNRSIQIPPLSGEDMLQLSLTREALEALVTFQTASRIVAGEVSIEGLEKLNQRMNALAAIGDTGVLLGTGLDFHEFIRVHSGNHVAAGLLRQLMLRMERYRQCIRTLEGRTRHNVHEHDGILEASRKGDPEGAAKAAREHVANARESYRVELAKHGLF
jgi:DNA-binding GntR family transcriptional regulator